MKRYGAKYRTIFNRETKEIKKVYSPVIYIDDRPLFISNDGEIIEYNNRKDALESAKETYLEHKEKLFNKK